MSLLFASALLSVVPLQAQTPDQSVNVFLDCSDCDRDFIRTEITYVNWVRDRAVADVHVLVSEEPTGGGGDRYTFHFTGLRGFAGREDTLAYTTSNNDTDDEERRGYTRALAIGLVPYVARSGNGLRQLQIGWTSDTQAGGRRTRETQQHDPWNYWVFTVGLNSSVDGEESQNSLEWEARLEANRTTEEYKIQVELDGEYEEENFTLDEDDSTTREIVSIQKAFSLEGLAVKSLGQHWSFGVVGEAQKATFGNIALGLDAGPAIEYSFWPYSQATRRALVVRYSTRVRSFEYEERTIYDKLQETHPVHTLQAELNMLQRWGSLNFETDYSQYLHNTAFYQISTFASADVRLFRGFSVDFFASYSRVRDQLALPQEELTPEEILLRQQELRTGYRYSAGVGVSYSFGSIFNNIVNPRF